ncbi:hypothetical protein [Agarivorans aestuarii]|uniref:hypothetical protein n=1 Tax=Agarivorans aestuarii TaxID=1563703 RepID=UPI001C7E9EBD|nr:hypothetical protein [Agarivorans aestuarii]
MYLHLGIKKRNTKRIGYSRDYCNYCEKPVIAELWRYRAWLGLFWIPILPLNKRQHWLCSECNNQTDSRYTNGLVSKVVILLFSLIVTGLLFDPEASQYSDYIWWLRGLSFAINILCFVWLLKHKKRPSHKQRRAKLEPLKAAHCHFCQGPLYIGLETRCDTCQLKVYKTVKDATNLSAKRPY